MVKQSLIFHSPNGPPEEDSLLARYLPPVPKGVFSTWLAEEVPTGSLILDPFGASPAAVLEAAQAGYRLLVTANNPINRVLHKIYALGVDKSEITAALAELASARRGDERLEAHIRQLYTTRCTECNAPVEVEAFVWERDTEHLLSQIYTCQLCGSEGEFPASDQDQAQARQFHENKLHRARAIERVAPQADPDRAYVEKALAVYPGRQLYALITIINRLDGLQLNPRTRMLMETLILHACDQGNAFWHYPARRERPRQLMPPPTYQEKNLWLALEEFVANWDSTSASVHLAEWPDIGEKPGSITLVEGKLRDLVPIFSNSALQIDAAIAVLPRLNPVYWTLSALWAGWLRGHHALGSFRTVLRRQRYDWAWHTEALHSVFAGLQILLPSGTPILGLICEAETNFLTAAALAAAESGFELHGLAIQEESHLIQFSLASATEIPSYPSDPPEKVSNLAADAAQTIARRRAEPSPYLTLQAGALASVLPYFTRSKPADTESLGKPGLAQRYSSLHETLENSFSYRLGWLRYGGTEKNPASSKWWLRTAPLPQPEPLADRVEKEIVQFLVQNQKRTLREIEQHVNSRLPGLFTPSPGMIQSVLDSYASQSEEETQIYWILNSQDNPRQRQADLQEINIIIETLGQRLGYLAEKMENAIIWKTIQSSSDTIFFPLASAVFTELVINSPFSPEKCIIAIPGSRAALALQKLQNNPYLKQAIERGWRFIKFRQLRHLHNTPILSQATLSAYFEQDPISGDDPQLRLI